MVDNPSGADTEIDQEGLHFDPISRETISAQIRAQLLRRITTGELRPGARVPSERDLAEQFKVARTSVREAIQGLLSLGVVVRRGNRSFVAEHLPEVVVSQPGARKDFIDQLFETRRVLEVAIFALAAVRADSHQRAGIADLADRFHVDLDQAEFRQADREFHTSVAAACGNPLLTELYGKVLDQLYRSEEFDAVLVDGENRADIQELVTKSGATHEAIALAYSTGDLEEMRRCTRDHVGTLVQTMVNDLL